MITPCTALLLGALLASPPVALKPIPLMDGEFSISEGSPWEISDGGGITERSFEPREVENSIEWFDGSVAAISKGVLTQTLVDSDGQLILAQPGDHFQIGFGLGSVGDGTGSLIVSLLGTGREVLIQSKPIMLKGSGAAAVYRHFLDLVIPKDAAPNEPVTIAMSVESEGSKKILIDKVSMSQVDVDEKGFVSLFNGVDLDGWVGTLTGYGVEDGAIRTYPKRAGGNIYTADEFGDFAFRFRFKVEPGSNNGIAIRAPLGGDAAYQGMEVQVLENSHKKYAGLKDWQFHGSIYGIAAAERGYQRPPGEWNDQEIRVHGRRVTVTLNGHVIADVNLDEALANGALSGNKHPGAARKSGHIGFCGHGDLVYYTDLRIKPIAETK